MTTKSKASTRTYKPSSILTLIGALLAFAWPIIIARSSMHLFYCSFAGVKPCPDQGNLSDVLAIGPAIVGGFLLALGYVYNRKMDRSRKALTVIAVTAAFCFISYFLLWAWLWIEIQLFG